MSFKCSKGLWVTNGILTGIPDEAHTWKARELKTSFVWWAVRRLADEKWIRSLDEHMVSGDTKFSTANLHDTKRKHLSPCTDGLRSIKLVALTARGGIISTCRQTEDWCPVQTCTESRSSRRCQRELAGNCRALPHALFAANNRQTRCNRIVPLCTFTITHYNSG